MVRSIALTEGVPAHRSRSAAPSPAGTASAAAGAVIGWPQWGQLAAALDTAPRHSGQLTRAIASRVTSPPAVRDPPRPADASAAGVRGTTDGRRRPADPAEGVLPSWSWDPEPCAGGSLRGNGGAPSRVR